MRLQTNPFLEWCLSPSLEKNERKKPMFRHIVIPLDSSTGAEHAIPIAARLAHVSGGKIVLVRVLSSPVDPNALETTSALAGRPALFENPLTEATHYLARVTSRYANELNGLQVEQAVEGGSASSAILALARQEHNDLIVLSSHRAHGLFHWTLSGVIHESLHHDPVPLLLLNEAGASFLASYEKRPLRVLIPLSGSALCETVIEPALCLAFALAGPTRSMVHFCQVVDQPGDAGEMEGHAGENRKKPFVGQKEAEVYLQALAARLQTHESCPMITWSVRISTDVAGTIAHLAEPSESTDSDRGYDLVALTTHGRHSLEHLMLGSVTERVLGATRRPLLLVRPPCTGGERFLL